MHTCLNANKLTLNMTKTEFMLIGSGQRLNIIAASPSALMNGTQVKQVATTKSLGITIDDRLSGNCHIEKLTKKISSGIGAMKRVRHLVPPVTLHLIYQALIQPHFDYCSTVWEPVGLLYKTSCKNCRIKQPASQPSLIMMLMLNNCWKSWGGKILITSEIYKRPSWYSNAYMG